MLADLAWKYVGASVVWRRFALFDQGLPGCSATTFLLYRLNVCVPIAPEVLGKVLVPSQVTAIRQTRFHVCLIPFFRRFQTTGLDLSNALITFENGFI